MKRILLVHTGGTIGSVSAKEQRDVNVSAARRTLLSRFADSASPYASLSEELFEDAAFPYETLSENMTPPKWTALLSYLGALELSRYAGVILLHGTDTLAYTASLLSLCFSDAPVPILLVAGARPPADPLTNAVANFSAAVSLIMEGIAPHVYVPYRNGDGAMYLHMGATLLQCPSFSDDFRSADPSQSLSLDAEPRSEVLEKCRMRSETRRGIRLLPGELKTDAVLCLYPYVGLDYTRIALDGVHAVLHGAYHSGTVCVERGHVGEAYGKHSFLTLADACSNRGIPLFIAPCAYTKEKYSTTADAVENGAAIPLFMTTESAYVKLCLGLSLGYEGERLISFMKENQAGEIVG